MHINMWRPRSALFTRRFKQKQIVRVRAWSLDRWLVQCTIYHSIIAMHAIVDF
jgi:hypothetical protein